MKILSMRMMRTPIRVRQKNKTTKWQLNYSQSIINIKNYIVVLRSAVFLFHFRFNTAGQGWGPSSSWDGSEPPLLPSLWLDDFPGVHPTKSLRCSSGWGHPSGRPAPPPAGQICCWCSTFPNLLTCHSKYFLWVISALWHCIHLVFCANSFKYHHMPEIFGSKENDSTI